VIAATRLGWIDFSKGTFFLPMGWLIVTMKHAGPWFDPGTTALLLSLSSTAIAVLLYRSTAHHGLLRHLFERPRWATLSMRREAPQDTRPRPLHP
jgi:hypothetical protein